MEFKHPRSSRQKLHSEKIQWPAASNKDILKLFTLSRTHQILSGNSRIFEDNNKEGASKDQGANEAKSKFEEAPEIISLGLKTLSSLDFEVHEKTLWGRSLGP